MASSEGKLRCAFQSSAFGAPSDEELEAPASPLWFKPNQGKISSFLLDLNSGETQSQSAPSHHAIPFSPCNCYIECLHGSDKSFYFLGGFQLISTARSVEVYTTKKGSTEEVLLMTCRGIPVRDKSSNVSNCFKVFSVVPGGPRPVTQLRLNLLPGKDDDASTETKLVSIQLTGRIPDPQQLAAQRTSQQTPKSQITPSSAMMLQQMMAGSDVATPLASGSSNNPFFSPPSAERGRPPPTPSGTHPSEGSNNSTEAIIAGVTFLVRSEGKATVDQIQGEFQKQQVTVQHQLRAMEQKMEKQQSMMMSMMQQQQMMLQKQLEMMDLLQQQPLGQLHQQAAPRQLGDENGQSSNTASKEPTEPINTNDESADSFPMESTYDPSCRVKMTESMEDKAAAAVKRHSPEPEEAKEAEEVAEEESDDGDVEWEDHGKESSKEEVPPPPPQETVAEDEDEDDDVEWEDHNEEWESEEERQEPGPESSQDATPAEEAAEEEDEPQFDSTSEPATSTQDATPAEKVAEEEDESQFDSTSEPESEDEEEEKESVAKDKKDDLGKKDDDSSDDNSGFLGLGGSDSDDSSDESGSSEEDRGNSKGGNYGGKGHRGGDPPDEAAEQCERGVIDDCDNEITEKGDNEDRKGNRGGDPPTETERQYDRGVIFDFRKKYVDNEFLDKQLVFVASKKGVFPNRNGIVREQCPSHEYGEEAHGGAYVESSYFGAPTIERKRSMVDHLSIRYCNTAVTGLPSASFDETQTSINQAESIEVLAMFPASPSTVDESPMNSPSTAADSGDIDDLNPSYESEFDRSFDEDDLCSVSMGDEENEEPESLMTGPQSLKEINENGVHRSVTRRPQSVFH